MTKTIYCVRDAMTGFITPFVSQNDDVAKRDFAMAVMDNDLMSVNANDFDLYRICSFDDESGFVAQPEPPIKIASGGAIHK